MFLSVTVRLIDLGPTEATISTHLRKVEKGALDGWNIGQAVGQNVCIVLNRSNQPVIQGGIGELCILGPQLSRGYLESPDLNDKLFPKNLLGCGERLYKTGDLVQQHSSGYHILGRIDNQIKIRGHRVDVDQIHSILNDALLFNTFAVGTTTVNEKLELMVWYNLDSSDISFDILLEESFSARHQDISQHGRRYLSMHLPPYMIPKFWIAVSSIPLTASGKVDYKTLSSATLDNWAEIMKCINFDKRNEPLTLLEQDLATSWAKVLGIPIDVLHQESSFIDLGGDSLLAVHLIAELTQKNFHLPISCIFSDFSLERMATSLEPLIKNSQIKPFSLIDFTQENLATILGDFGICSEWVEDAYPITPTQHSLLFGSLKNNGAYVNQALYELSGDIDSARLRKAIVRVVNENSILRTTFVYGDSSLLKCFDGALQLVLKAENALLWKEVPFNDFEKVAERSRKEVFAFGQPFMSFLIAQSPDGLVLAWNRHHALYDGWSMQKVILIDDRYGLIFLSTTKIVL